MSGVVDNGFAEVGRGPLEQGDAGHPIWALTWIVQSWAGGLAGGARKQFLKMPLGDLLADPATLIEKPWARELSSEKNLELAGNTVLIAHKAR